MNNKIIGLEKRLKQTLIKKNKLLSKTHSKRKRTESDAAEEEDKKSKKRRVSFKKIPECDEESNTTNGLQYNMHLEEESSEVSDSESNLEDKLEEDDKMDVSEKLVDEETSDNEDNVIEDSSEKEGSESEDSHNEGEQQEMEEANSNEDDCVQPGESDDNWKDEENINHENGEIELDSDEKRPVTSKGRVSFSLNPDYITISDDNRSLSPEKFVPPGVESFFDSEDDSGPEKSSDEDTIEENCKPKKKKLTRAEQAELLKQQEEELRKKELEFAEPKGTPESAEQFDRRLLAEPNSSELWAKYVSFLLSTAELDKARSVMKRALQTVDQTAEQERMNLWITYLNLENNYGTDETFKQVFDEAVRCNDDFAIYMEAINILSSSNKSITADYIKKARAKFKQNPKMYTNIGKIYYLQKNFDEARKLRNIALTTLTNYATHIPLTVQFATMEFTYGEDCQAEALFETVLQSNPKRVDVWTSYVDQLVKKNKIDVARRVLERAVSQKLNLKKMRTLHKKFQQFEVKYGNDETRTQWQKLFENYTKQFGKSQE